MELSDLFKKKTKILFTTRRSNEIFEGVMIKDKKYPLGYRVLTKAMGKFSWDMRFITNIIKLN